MSTQIIIYSVQCALTFKSLERETEIAQYIGDVFSQDDILKKTFFLVAMFKHHLKLYKGASGEGYVLLIADKDDAGYAVFQGDTWFTLS